MNCNDIEPKISEWKMTPDCGFERTKKEITTLYKVGKELGRGWNGIVFSLHPIDQNVKMKAVKFITNDMDIFRQKKNLKTEYEISRKFTDEKGLTHPHKAFFFLNGDLICFCKENIYPLGALVMSKYEGSLKDIIPTMSIGEQENAIRQIVHGLGVLHKNNIVHRDVYFTNVFYRTERGNIRYDLADLDQGLECPENIEKLKRNDIEYLGCLLKAILTRNFFGCGSLYDPRHNISEALICLIEKMGNRSHNEILSIEEIVNEMEKLSCMHIDRDPSDPLINITPELARKIAYLRENVACFEKNHQETANYYKDLINNLIAENKS